MPSDTPIVGSATCVCSTHQVTVEADTDAYTRPQDRHVNLVYWRRGSDFSGNPPWGMRLRLAWAWLRGDPQSVQGILLDQGEYAKLMDGLREAARRTWGDHAE